MFSNGTEYECFLDSNCYKCRKYRNALDTIYSDFKNCKPCKIEYRIALASNLCDEEQKKTFPFEFLKENGHQNRYDCIKFDDKSKPYVPKHPRGHRKAKGQISLI
jgi:hypothetical protein